MLVLAETSLMMGDEALHPIVSPPLKREEIKTAVFERTGKGPPEWRPFFLPNPSFPDATIRSAHLRR
jgi:hypothetical protein